MNKNLTDSCKHDHDCNAPLCPVDLEMSVRVLLPKEDEICRYCRKRKSQGRREKLSKELIEHIPQQNIKLLTEKNHGLCQNAL